VGLIGTGVYSRQDTSGKPSGENHAAQPRKAGAREFSKGEIISKGSAKASRGEESTVEKLPPPSRELKEQAYDDADKEGLRLANKLLQEEIEDEKVKLTGLEKKLERLKNSGIKLAPEDPDLAKLRRENRRLQKELEHLQDDVRLLEEEVLPYIQKLQKGAGNAPWYRNDLRKSGYPRGLPEKKG